MRGDLIGFLARFTHLQQVPQLCKFQDVLVEPFQLGGAGVDALL